MFPDTYTLTPEEIQAINASYQVPPAAPTPRPSPLARAGRIGAGIGRGIQGNSGYNLGRSIGTIGKSIYDLNRKRAAQKPGEKKPGTADQPKGPTATGKSFDAVQATGANQQKQPPLGYEEYTMGDGPQQQAPPIVIPAQQQQQSPTRNAPPMATGAPRGGHPNANIGWNPVPGGGSDNGSDITYTDVNSTISYPGYGGTPGSTGGGDEPLTPNVNSTIDYGNRPVLNYPEYGGWGWSGQGNPPDTSGDPNITGSYPGFPSDGNSSSDDYGVGNGDYGYWGWDGMGGGDGGAEGDLYPDEYLMGATGLVVDEPTKTIIGEGGQPEYVVPADKAQEFSEQTVETGVPPDPRDIPDKPPALGPPTAPKAVESKPSEATAPVAPPAMNPPGVSRTMSPPGASPIDAARMRALNARAPGGTPGFVNGPIGLNPQQQPGQLPPVPQIKAPSTWRRIASAGVGALAGVSNARGGAAKIDPSAAQQEILYPGQSRAMGNYKLQMERAKEQSAMDKAAADASESQARGKLYNQQADTLAQEGKRAPAKNVVAFGTDGLFDATTGTVLREPSGKAAADYIEIAPDKAKALGLQPDAEGKFRIPKEGIGPYLTSQMRPEKPAPGWQTKSETDAQGNVWEWRVDPQSGESTNPVNKGKIGKPQQQPAAIQLGAQLAGNADAVTLAATQYRQTRTMPPVGRNPMMAVAILKKAAELDKAEGISPDQSGVNAELFKANRAALADLTKRESQVGSFEKTAGKNLDIFLQQAAQLGDTGTPLLNRPIRALQRDLMGDPRMAGFNAAMQTASTEVSRVLSGQAGGVLSDSARDEAKGLLRGDYTLAQLQQAVKILRLDMKSRMDSFAQQKAELQQSMGGGAGQQGGGRGSPQAPAQYSPNNPFAKQQ